MLNEIQPYVLTALGTAGLWQFFAQMADYVRLRKVKFVARSLAEKVSICRTKGIEAGLDISDWPQVSDNEIL